MAATLAEPTSQRFLQLVADPQRWALLQALARSDQRVGELSSLVDKPQNLVSYHLGELRSAGLISSRRSAADGRDSYYRIDMAQCAEQFAKAGLGLHPGLAMSRLPTDVTARRRRSRVLFLCTGNSARSQIAEALLEQRSAHTIEARSAGSNPKPLHPDAVRVMAARGIDIAGRPSKHLDRYARTRFDWVVTLCDKVKEVCPEMPGQPASAHWSMADPAADSTYAAFVRTADEIEERIEYLIARITAET